MARSMKGLCVVACIMVMLPGSVFAQPAAAKKQTRLSAAPGVTQAQAAKPQKPPRSGLDLRSPTFVIEPEYGRYGYLGDGIDPLRERAIYHSR